jgi:hypothetical protein
MIGFVAAKLESLVAFSVDQPATIVAASAVR